MVATGMKGHVRTRHAVVESLTVEDGRCHPDSIWAATLVTGMFVGGRSGKNNDSGDVSVIDGCFARGVCKSYSGSETH